MAAARYWFFTHNLPDGVDFDPEGEMWFHDKEITYFKAQVEVAPTTGKVHWQGVFDLSRKQKLPWLKRHLSPTANFSATRNRMRASKYVFKDDTAYEPPIRLEWGQTEEEKPMETAIELVRKGKSNLEIADRVPKALVLYGKGLGILRSLWAKPRDFQTELYVLWGGTGCGKSHWAHQYGEKMRCYEKDGEAKYWCGYDGHESVIIEEFDKNPLSLGKLLRLADKYPVKVEPKGLSEVEFVAKRIFLTASTHPSGWYRAENAWPQIQRRITRMAEFNIPWEEGMVDEEGPWPELLVPGCNQQVREMAPTSGRTLGPGEGVLQTPGPLRAAPRPVPFGSRDELGNTGTRTVSDLDEKKVQELLDELFS